MPISACQSLPCYTGLAVASDRQRERIAMSGEAMHVDASTTVEDLRQVVAVMRRQESTTYQRTDYLAASADLSETVVDASWRQRIIEWMYGVVDHCALRRDSVAVATFYLDLCVERGLIKSRQEFQLSAMTALQLAIKLYDSTMVKLDSMVKLGRGLFTEEDVIEMESKMLAVLKWQVHPPTPACFLRQFLRLLPAQMAASSRYMIAEVTRFISEISVCLYKFIKYPPSTVAYAGILIAMDRLDNLTLPHWQRCQVYEIMRGVAGLDNQSFLVQEVVDQLYHSLEKNISLQELMNTIDAQCQCGYTKARTNNLSTTGGSVNSPRDIRGNHV
jgi:Cyclin, N-terminal domain/Cyclin, C-terminal domain